MKPQIRIISDSETAKNVWNALSPHLRIYDEWEFRYEYYKYFLFPLFFYTAYNDETPIALLPLQLNTETKTLEFFGGSYMEDNCMFLQEPFASIQEVVLDAIDKPAELSWMTTNFAATSHTAAVIEQKYELPLADFTSSDDYLEKYWSPKSRKNVKAQIRKLYERDIQISFNTFADIEVMVELNKKRFGEESTFAKPHRLEFLKDLMQKYPEKCKVITISIDGKKESVGFSFIHNGIYNGLNSGTNAEVNGLGKLMILQKIQQAIDSGATLYDARAGDLGWKESFHFHPRPQYTLQLTP